MYRCIIVQNFTKINHSTLFFTKCSFHTQFILLLTFIKSYTKSPENKFPSFLLSGNSSQPYLTMRLVAAAVAVTAAATVVVATAAIAAAAVVGRAAIAATSTAIAVKAAAATAEDQDENQNPPVIVTVHK